MPIRVGYLGVPFGYTRFKTTHRLTWFLITGGVDLNFSGKTGKPTTRKHAWIWCLDGGLQDCQVKELYVFVRLCMHVCRCVCLPSVCRSVCKSVCMYLSLHGRPNESSRWLKASQCVDGFIGGCERIYYFPMRLSLPSDNFWQSNAALENPYFQTSNTVRDFPSIFYKLFGCRLD